jgi:hypothetical protein
MSIYSIIIYVTAVVEIILGIFIVLSNRHNKVNQLYGIVCFVTVCWIISNALIVLQPSDFWVRNSYATAIFLAPAILIWIEYFITKKNPGHLKTFILFGSTIIIYCITLFSDLVIENVQVTAIGGFDGTFGPLFPLFALDWGIVSIYILFLVTKAFRNSKGLEKIQFGYIAAGLYGFGFVAGIVSFILPLLGITELIPLDVPSSLIFIAAMSLAILKHHLFNIKVIAVQLITFALWIFILIRTMLSETPKDFMIQGSLLLITVIFGVILIRSVLHEMKQREQIEKLAKDIKLAYAQVKDINEHLEDKIAEQTADVRRAYEVEKKARAELEELNKTKDQFITSTQHHLRTPMTSLKWELESIRNGARGPVGSELKEGLGNADESVRHLTDIIENFISITEKKV